MMVEMDTRVGLPNRSTVVNSMHMIWHNNEIAYFNIWEMVGNFNPAIMGDSSTIIRYHFIAYDFPKKHCFIWVQMVTKYAPGRV